VIKHVCVRKDSEPWKVGNLTASESFIHSVLKQHGGLKLETVWIAKSGKYIAHL
jgi:hypothetical protein